MTTIRRLLLLSSMASACAFVAPPHRAALIAPSSLRADAAAEGTSEENDETTAAKEGTAATEADHSLPSEEQSDIMNSPAFLKRKAEVLQSDVAAIEKEIEEAQATYDANKEEWGAKFDTLNKESQLAQERLSKQGEQGKEMASVDVASKILNVLDNYDRAFQAVEAVTNEEVEIVDAYRGTYDMILDAFQTLNVTKIDTVGHEFDYELHQAMMQMPSDEYDDGIVCQEFAMGWRCGETLIRPAMVAVAGDY